MCTNTYSDAVRLLLSKNRPIFKADSTHLSRMTERISRKQGSSMLFRFFRATAVGAIAVGAYVLLQPRVAIPAHLAGHKVLNIPNLISEVTMLLFIPFIMW